jgi:pyruvate ferredoxin oxidoreductase delta subunit
MKIGKEKMKWQELPAGDLLDPGTAAQFKTGDWRSEKPVWNKEKCINCKTCWICCPDSAIIIENEKVAGIDYDHCKGCGICAKECPPKVKAITMEKEKK